MVKGLAPANSNDLVPMSVGSLFSYSLRDSNNLQNIICRTSVYLNSFISFSY